MSRVSPLRRSASVAALPVKPDLPPVQPIVVDLITIVRTVASETPQPVASRVVSLGFAGLALWGPLAGALARDRRATSRRADRSRRALLAMACADSNDACYHRISERSLARTRAPRALVEPAAAMERDDEDVLADLR